MLLDVCKKNHCDSPSKKHPQLRWSIGIPIPRIPATSTTQVTPPKQVSAVEDLLSSSIQSGALQSQCEAQRDVPKVTTFTVEKMPVVHESM